MKSLREVAGVLVGEPTWQSTTAHTLILLLQLASFFLPSFFEEFASNFASTLLKVAEVIPPSYINVPLTFLNYPEICLYVTELSLSRRKYQKLQELGYDVDWGCVVACGYGDLTIKRRGQRITWTVIECMCHPGHYFLVLKPVNKER